MVLMCKAERQLEKQTGTTEGKMARGSAFPVRWQVNSAFMKLSKAGWTPEGPRVCAGLISSISALWPGHDLPSDSGLATSLHHGEACVPVLVCSAQKCPFCTAPKSTRQCTARKCRRQATQFEETETADATHTHTPIFF